ncbi:MAG: UDP-N-acetyl glucosamine 2-epimerase, partial [Prevotellaceae bacterium]|nr:UDP-N-acetyl glucosamine 2-epimerase [Prevotellaceae bacterium]
NIENQEFALVTIHRDNNTDNSERLTAIVEALLEITDATKIVLPLHPRTKKLLPENLSQSLYDKLLNNCNIQIVPPVSFFEIIALEKHSKLIMTDSGGLQKEAYFFKKPCVILRPETEWVEIVKNGTGIIADASKMLIINAFKTLKNGKFNFSPVFGDGQASEFILRKTLETF